MYTTLDKIVRSLLLKKGLPLHFYVQFLKLTADAVRELSFDSARIVNAIDLIINPNDYTAELPCDYVDWTLVGFPVGQMVRPINEVDSINRLPALTPGGEGTTYTTYTDQFQNPLWPGWNIFPNINELGENTGGRFGISAASNRNGFKIFKERGIIQLTETYMYPSVRLEYIGDGQCCDNASKVDPLAQQVIEDNADWQFKVHSIKSGLGEQQLAKAKYGESLRKYRARKSDLTITAIKQAIYRSYKQSPKT